MHPFLPALALVNMFAHINQPLLVPEAPPVPLQALQLVPRVEMPVLGRKHTHKKKPKQ